jgi:hypothetical protein
MSRPAWGTAPIRCGKMKCKWRGYETDLVSVPHKKLSHLGVSSSVCPACGCDSYMHMTEREIAAWKRATHTAAQAATDKPLTCCAAARDGDCSHKQCPQLRDNEPRATGRHCPLDNDNEADE